MPVGKLGTYVMDTQQPYIKKALATFLLCSKMIREANKKEVGAKIFDDLLLKLGDLIEKHLEQDELILFPYLRSKILNKEYNTSNDLPVSLRKIKAEHIAIAKFFKKVRLISNDYTPSPGSSPALKLCYAQLFNFEQDMLKCIFLEEDILFPKLLSNTAG